MTVIKCLFLTLLVSFSPWWTLQREREREGARERERESERERGLDRYRERGGEWEKER